MEGYIALYRCLLDKPIWKQSTPEQKTILITLLLMANHEENEWEWQGQKFKVFPGQFVTSLDSIVKTCGKGITIQNVRSALLRFEKLEFLTNASTKTGRFITILKWHTYQVDLMRGNKETNKEVTKTQQRPNKEVTTNNNDKNDNNDKKNISSKDDTLTKVNSLCPHNEILKLYNSICKSLPKINEMTNSRQDTIRTWWKKGIGLQELEAFFHRVETSDFLTNRTGKFTASFDWITKPANRQKILEGNYDNKKVANLDDWRNF